jgi:hypothetical protein
MPATDALLIHARGANSPGALLEILKKSEKADDREQPGTEAFESIAKNRLFSFML